jgi:hypothetical protein
MLEDGGVVPGRCGRACLCPCSCLPSTGMGGASDRHRIRWTRPYTALGTLPKLFETQLVPSSYLLPPPRSYQSPYPYPYRLSSRSVPNSPPPSPIEAALSAEISTPFPIGNTGRGQAFVPFLTSFFTLSLFLLLLLFFLYLSSSC